MLGLLRLDPKFVRLNDAVTGMRARRRRGARAWSAQWQNLAGQVSETKVARGHRPRRTLEQEHAADANALVEDLRRLARRGRRARAELRARRARRHGARRTSPPTRSKRLDELGAARSTPLAAARPRRRRGRRPARQRRSRAGAAPLIAGRPRRGAPARPRAARARCAELEAAGDKLARRASSKLYDDTRRVLDKAKLGKIDAVIGQKRKLDIEVQDLAAGRFPEELIGQLWNAGLIGDDEEFWPCEGEYWADEYEGWR